MPSDQSDRVTVAVVNYNAGPLLRQCWQALARQDYANFEVVLIDNASHDRSCDDLPDLPVPTRHIFNAENRGFAVGVNQAAAAATGAWLATLNPDAVPASDWLTRLMAAAHHAEPTTAMFGSLQRDLERPELLDGHGDVYHATGMFWRAGHGQPTAGAPDSGPIFAPCAAAALYRRDALRAMGGFAEAFFCYAEDVDLGFRMRLAGYNALRVSEAVVDHHGGACSPDSAFAVRYGTRNRLWTFVRNMPGVLFWPLLPVHLALSALAVVRHAVSARGRGHGKAALVGLVEGVAGIPRQWHARRAIQAGRTVGPGAVIGWLTWSPIAVYKRASAGSPPAPAIASGATPEVGRATAAARRGPRSS
jgi:GT2 family glycosyltransferase